MDQQGKIRVAIIGCGLIGTQWDEPGNGSAHSLTHAAGFSKNPACRIVAVCDRDLAKAASAAARWGDGRAFADPQALFSEIQVDLAVIATSSAARWSVIAPALAAGVKVFVIEKPLATTLAESYQLVASLDAAGAKTVVNYSRHWDPAMSTLRDKIAAGEFGHVQRLLGLYGKGIVNNGSHMIDLVSNLFAAQPLRVRALGTPLASNESAWSGGSDTTADAQIVFADRSGAELQLTLLGTNQSDYSCFELKIIGTMAICEILQGGRRISIRPVVPDPDYANYRIPGDPAELEARAMESMDRMVDESVKLTLGQTTCSSCDVHVAMTTAVTVNAIKNATDDGQWIPVGPTQSN